MPREIVRGLRQFKVFDAERGIIGTVGRQSRVMSGGEPSNLYNRNQSHIRYKLR